MSPDGVKEAEEKNRKRVASFQEEQWGGWKKEKKEKNRCSLCGAPLETGRERPNADFTSSTAPLVWVVASSPAEPTTASWKKEEEEEKNQRRAARVLREGGRRDAPIGELSPVSSTAAAASTWGKEAGNKGEG